MSNSIIDHQEDTQPFVNMAELLKKAGVYYSCKDMWDRIDWNAYGAMHGFKVINNVRWLNPVWLSDIPKYRKFIDTDRE